MSEYNYEISLRPVEHYFFGGERTFDRAGEEKSSFYAVSNPYPQQTTLLGLLRYLLLKQNGFLPLTEHNKTLANNAIGERSFKVTATKEQSFGYIKAVAPLLFRKGSSYYRLGHELPQGQYCKKKGIGEVLAADGVREFIPVLKEYNAKKGLPLKAIPTEATEQSIALDSIFQAQEHIGILKQSTEEGFFKQKVYSLNDDWSFSLFARLEGDFELKDGTVKFGADQKPFFVQVKKISTEAYPRWGGVAEEADSLTLLSDAMVDQNIYTHCDFAISDTADFRTVRMGYRGNDFHKDEQKYNLLKRGTVLFPKEGSMKALEDALQHENFRKIGFNQYFKSKK